MCAQSCPTLCDSMDCSPPGSSFHGIFQARVLEWAAISSSRGTSQPWYQTHFSCIAGRFFTTELPRKSFESQRGEQLIIVLIAHETNLPHSPSVRCLFSVFPHQTCVPHRSSAGVLLYCSCLMTVFAASTYCPWDQGLYLIHSQLCISVAGTQKTLHKYLIKKL